MRKSGVKEVDSAKLSKLFNAPSTRSMSKILFGICGIVWVSDWKYAFNGEDIK
jgi:hypothetical protein